MARNSADPTPGTPGRWRRGGTLALTIAALSGAAVTTLTLTGGAASASSALTASRHRADLAVTASDVVLVRPEGDTRWRSELVMTVRAKSGSTARTRLTFQLNPGVSVLAAPHPGGDPAGSLAFYNCTAAGAGYDCDLGALKAGSSVTVRLKVDTDMPGIAFVPEPVTVTQLTRSGRQVHDRHPADNTTQYTTRVA